MCMHPMIDYWKWEWIIIINSFFDWLIDYNVFPIIGTPLTNGKTDAGQNDPYASQATQMWDKDAPSGNKVKI